MLRRKTLANLSCFLRKCASNKTVGVNRGIAQYVLLSK